MVSDMTKAMFLAITLPMSLVVGGCAYWIAATVKKAANDIRVSQFDATERLNSTIVRSAKVGKDSATVG